MSEGVPEVKLRTSPPKLSARLVWEEEAKWREQAMGSGEFTIGRSSDNDLSVSVLEASRFHCKIIPDALGFTIVDLGSTNGTFVNGERVKEILQLRHGDRLQIGIALYRFEILPPKPAPDVPPIITLKNVIKDYESPAGRVRVLNGVNLQVHQGEFVGIRGPSGCGKSTLLNMITGIDRPTSGEVIVSEQPLGKLSENRMARWRGIHIGVIFQFFQLLPTLTVIENVMLPMDLCRKWKPRERAKRALTLLDQVGLADQAYKLPSTLSGGQQQRAAIARALANDPPLVVGDEPTGNLDTKTADRVISLFEDLIDRGKTFLMVTHDLGLAERIPRVIEVLDGQLNEARRSTYYP